MEDEGRFDDERHPTTNIFETFVFEGEEFDYHIGFQIKIEDDGWYISGEPEIYSKEWSTKITRDDLSKTDCAELENEMYKRAVKIVESL